MIAFVTSLRGMSRLEALWSREIESDPASVRVFSFQVEVRDRAALLGCTCVRDFVADGVDSGERRVQRLRDKVMSSPRLRGLARRSFPFVHSAYSVAERLLRGGQSDSAELLSGWLGDHPELVRDERIAVEDPVQLIEVAGADGVDLEKIALL